MSRRFVQSVLQLNDDLAAVRNILEKCVENGGGESRPGELRIEVEKSIFMANNFRQRLKKL